MPEKTLLYYSHDPMCSFCWAFRPVWARVRSSLAKSKPELTIINVMGGLAPDSDEPMPEEVRSKVRAAWQYIEQNIPGIQFNYDFWSQQKPRRSTYPACRAVIATKILDARLNYELEEQMILAIQQAYYLNAQNPSNAGTLISCAESIGLDKIAFTKTLHSTECHQAFEQDRALSQSLGISSFPGLVIARGNSRFNIPVDYNNASRVLDRLFEAISLL
ncbi:MAG: DsbA family protein [Proteobacteria bacterium]|nr:DsbA family protein [Pseudomonadota bacterium]